MAIDKDVKGTEKATWVMVVLCLSRYQAQWALRDTFRRQIQNKHHVSVRKTMGWFCVLAIFYESSLWCIMLGVITHTLSKTASSASL